MHLYISESSFVCAVSLTQAVQASSGTTYINYQSPFTLPLKLELFSCENDMLAVSVRVALTSLPAPLAIKRSAQNRQDVRLTGRSPIRAGHVRNRPIPITGQSIGASLMFVIKSESFLKI